MPAEKEQLTTWMPSKEATALRRIAKQENRSVSQMIRVLVLAGLEQRSKAQA